MSTTARTDTKLKKERFGKKLKDDGGKSSPTHSEVEEKLSFKAIDGEDIQALAIKEEDLKKLAEPKKVKNEKQNDILVKKSNKNWYPTTEVKVAKLAQDKQPKPIDVTDNLGLRYDKYGNCVPHSILGTVEDYLQESISHGKSIEIPYKTLDTEMLDRPNADLYLKPEKKQKSYSGDNGESALINWKTKMTERKNVQNHLAKSTNRLVDNLIMNQSDNVQKYNELKTLIDRTLPLVEHGKGYRLGSEFWNQPLVVGAENGIHTTLKKSERGHLSPVELISKPKIALEETDFRENQPSIVHYPWDKSKYLKHRLETLKPLIEELVPHVPDFLNLQLIGKNPLNKDTKNNYKSNLEQSKSTWVNQKLFSENPSNLNDNNPYFINVDNYEDILAAHIDVIQPPIFGPSIVFGGQTAKWTGNENENIGIVALESRLNFETKAGKRVLATFEIVNTGTTTIYYDWKKIQNSNPFNILSTKSQRFYFDTRSSVILPGDLLKLHIVFKSTNGGIFSEKWEFITYPQMLGGASLILTLRGVAIQEDKFKKSRVLIERKLFIKEGEIIAKNMIELILSGVRTPERSQSPQNAFMTEEEQFVEMNQSLFYDHNSVSELKQLYAELYDGQEKPKEWDFSVNNFKQKIMDLDENDPKKQSLLNKLNIQISNMSFPAYTPNDSKMYSICYNALCSAVDEINFELTHIKTNLNLPVANPDEIYPITDELNNRYENWKKEFEIFKQFELEKKSRQEKEKGKDKGKGTAKAPEKKDEKKKEADKKKPTPIPSGGKVRTARDASINSRSNSRNQDKIDERVKSPIVLNEHQQQINKIFNEKAYTNVYQILYKMFDELDNSFNELMSNVEVTDILGSYFNQPSKAASLNIDYID